MCKEELEWLFLNETPLTALNVIDGVLYTKLVILKLTMDVAMGWLKICSIMIYHVLAYY